VSCPEDRGEKEDFGGTSMGTSLAGVAVDERQLERKNWAMRISMWNTYQNGRIHLLELEFDGH